MARRSFSFFSNTAISLCIEKSRLSSSLICSTTVSRYRAYSRSSKAGTLSICSCASRSRDGSGELSVLFCREAGEAKIEVDAEASACADVDADSDADPDAEAAACADIDADSDAEAAACAIDADSDADPNANPDTPAAVVFSACPVSPFTWSLSSAKNKCCSASGANRAASNDASLLTSALFLRISETRENASASSPCVKSDWNRNSDSRGVWGVWLFMPHGPPRKRPRGP